MESLVDWALYKIDKKCNFVDIILLRYHFRKYSEEELFNIAYDIDNIEAIEYLPMSPENKIKCYQNIGSKQNIVYTSYINKVLHPLCRSNPDIVLECLKYYELDYYRYRTLLLIKDEYKRILGIKSLHVQYREELVKSIKNKQVLEKAYSDGDLSVQNKYAIILELDDQFKVKHLYDFDLAEQLDIIVSLKSDDLKKKYVLMSRYSDYRAQIINAINDEDFIIDYFKKEQAINFRFQLITMMKNKKLKQQLIELLSPSVIKDVLKSNNLPKDSLNSIQEIAIPLENIDPKITFGLELECCGGESYDFLLIKNILKTWKITADGSVNGGIEVISPILRFEKKSLQELKYVCNLLRRGEFYTDERCGGHIHFGFNYFDNPQEFNMFLRLYCAIEDLLFIISNKQGTITRDGVDNYAKKFSQMYNDNKSFVFYAENIKRLGRYVKVVRDIPSTRYYALNIKNIGNKEKNTIEFRMPNGEIDYNEIILNILLFAKLMEKTKELNRLLNNKKSNVKGKDVLEKYRLLLDNDLSNDEKVKLLLELLFTDETIQNKYLERYYNNTKAVRGRYLRQNRFIENDML